jgi:hypothetical protein
VNSRVAISIHAGKLRQSVIHHRHHPLPLSPPLLFQHTAIATISATTVVKLYRHGHLARSGYATRTATILPFFIYVDRTLAQRKNKYAQSIIFEVRFEAFVAVTVRTIEESSDTEMEIGSFETSVPIYHTSWYVSSLEDTISDSVTFCFVAFTASPFESLCRYHFVV